MSPNLTLPPQSSTTMQLPSPQNLQTSQNPPQHPTRKPRFHCSSLLYTISRFLIKYKGYTILLILNLMLFVFYGLPVTPGGGVGGYRSEWSRERGNITGNNGSGVLPFTLVLFGWCVFIWGWCVVEFVVEGAGRKRE